MPASTLPPRPTEITNITETLELRGTWARRALRWFYAPIPPHPRERYRLHIIASNYDILASTLNLIQSRRDVAVIRPVASPILIDHAIAVTKQEIVSRFTVKLVFVTAADDNVISPLPIDVVLTVSPIDPENISVCIYAAVVTGASPEIVRYLFTEDQVFAAIAKDRIATIPRRDGVVAAATVDGVGASRAETCSSCAIHRCCPSDPSCHSDRNPQDERKTHSHSGCPHVHLISPSPPLTARSKEASNNCASGQPPINFPFSANSGPKYSSMNFTFSGSVKNDFNSGQSFSNTPASLMRP